MVASTISKRQDVRQSSLPPQRTMKVPSGFDLVEDGREQPDFGNEMLRYAIRK